MRRIAITLSLAAALASSAIVASADQAVCVTQKQAEKAARLIKDGDEVRSYCAPCNDSGYTTISVSQVTVGKDEICDAMLVLNGESVDLAYTYVRKGKKWYNLAKLAGAEAHDVPDVLPKDLPNAAAGD